MYNESAQVNSYFKGTQAWDNLEFFLPKSNPYTPFENFRKKFRFFSFDFRQNFKHFRGDWAYAESNFFDELSKNFFVKIFTLVLLDGFLGGFLKNSIIYSQNMHFNLVFLSIFWKL